MDVMMSMAEKAKKGGGGPSEPTGDHGTCPEFRRFHPAMGAQDGVQVISGQCRADTGIIGRRKLNWHP
jgi:hypothetical protein